MTLYIALFDVSLCDVDNLRFYRAIEAENDEQLRQKCEKLQKDYIEEYEELWKLYKFWDVEKIPFKMMSDFVMDA